MGRGEKARKVWLVGTFTHTEINSVTDDPPFPANLTGREKKKNKGMSTHLSCFTLGFFNTFFLLFSSPFFFFFPDLPFPPHWVSREAVFGGKGGLETPASPSSSKQQQQQKKEENERIPRQGGGSGDHKKRERERLSSIQSSSLSLLVTVQREEGRRKGG